MSREVSVWARLGVSIKVNEEDLLQDPQKALREAVNKGNFKANGDSYVPASITEGLAEQGLLTEDYPDEMEF